MIQLISVIELIFVCRSKLCKGTCSSIFGRIPECHHFPKNYSKHDQGNLGYWTSLPTSNKLLSSYHWPVYLLNIVCSLPFFSSYYWLAGITSGFQASENCRYAWNRGSHTVGCDLRPPSGHHLLEIGWESKFAEAGNLVIFPEALKLPTQKDKQKKHNIKQPVPKPYIFHHLST